MSILETKRQSTTPSGWATKGERDGFTIFQRVGAPQPGSDDWETRLARLGRTVHNVGVVGGKRLLPDGKAIHSLGDVVIHPKGFHHIGHGVPAEAYRFPVECDGFSGGVVAISSEVCSRVEIRFDGLGSLGMIALCLEVRRQGLRVIAAPEVEVVDSSTVDARPREAALFRERFGFEWRTPDLDAVRERYEGTGLLWNPRFLGEEIRYTKYETRPALHWRSYEEVPVYRSRADAIVAFISKSATEAGVAGAPLLDFGCGDGLFTHLLAQTGFAATGLDIESQAIDQARAATGRETYTGDSPAFVLGAAGPLPFDDAQFGTVAMLDVIEHLLNPVAVLREIHRVLRPGGLLMVSTPEWQYGAWSDAVFHVCEYTHHELVNQLSACGFAVETTARISKPYRDVVASARSI